MNWQEISEALLLEVIFAQWCGENYDLFHGGTFPGIGTPREIFIERLRAITRYY